MRFRKRPIEVEAIRFSATSEGLDRLRSFCGGSLGRVIRVSPGGPAEAEICDPKDGRSLIVKHVATEGEWIVKDGDGSLHPCRPEIFESLYDPI